MSYINTALLVIAIWGMFVISSQLAHLSVISNLLEEMKDLLEEIKDNTDKEIECPY